MRWTLDIAMGGSTNTILHLLAIAHEAGVDFTDEGHRPSVTPGAQSVQGGASQPGLPRRRRAPCRRGFFTILGELDRAGLIHSDVATVHSKTLAEALDQNDVRRATVTPQALVRSLAAPGWRPHDRGLQPGQVLRQARRRRPSAAASVRPTTPTVAKVAWPSSTATSPRKAAS